MAARGRSSLTRGVFLVVLLASLVTAIVASAAQHAIFGDVNPLITGGVAGGVSAAVYMTMRNRL